MLLLKPKFHADIAQLVEQWFCKPGVAGSIPAVGTNQNGGVESEKRSVWQGGTLTGDGSMRGEQPG